MRYKKVYRDGVYVLVDPLTGIPFQSGAGMWDRIVNVASKFLPFAKKAAQAGVEAGSKRLGEHLATKAVDTVISKVTTPVVTTPVVTTPVVTTLPDIGQKIVNELIKQQPKLTVEERINRLLNT